ncbi:hypothetical protein CK203_086186 [Vitis vinifera]|uniref:Uncharacterized protein n=1 Tax=Vitis vinifera TaxID=29760 RepID=A0A438DXB9_VITVI|nr:hypothetical protein CK203_086186 [Vitis vinifera]
MEDEAKPVHQSQRKLNLTCKRWCELKFLSCFRPVLSTPYQIAMGESYSSCAKKSRIMVVQNDKGENVFTHLTIGWRVLERVSGHHFYCFLDGYSEYFKIEIDVEDQEKTTFTCPFGTMRTGMLSAYAMHPQLSKDAC